MLNYQKHKESGCKSKERIYYNVSIPHDDQNNPDGRPSPAKYLEIRDQSIISGRPCDYNLSVVRFSVPTTYIPIQYFPVEYDVSNPTNVNKSIYSITLEYNGTSFQKYIQWESQANYLPSDIPPPPSPNDKIYQTDPRYIGYYSLTSLNHFTYLINKTIEEVYDNDIKPLLPAGLQVYEAPYFYYDPKTSLFNLYYQFPFLDSAVTPVYLYMNTFLYTNFDGSYDVEYFNYDEPDGKNIKFILKDRGVQARMIDETDIVLPLDERVWYISEQEFNTTGLIQSFKSIVIKSNTLPINQEIISLQKLTGGNVGSQYESVLTDFEIDLGTDQNLKSVVTYVPTAEYRRITMTGESSINRIDISVYWKDAFGNLYDIQIPHHKEVTVKILFEEN